MSWPKDIVLIGAGNVAWHLGARLFQMGKDVVHVHARSAQNAVQLATVLHCEGSNQVDKIPTTADLYLIAVNDTAIASVAEQLADLIHPNSLLVHTSGATPSTVFQAHFNRHGVFYPLQTFSKGRAVDFSQVPLCICAEHAEDFNKLESLARELSNQVYAVSDEQRLQLHLAAIFVNNFTNYLQHIGGEILKKHQLPAEILHPLLVETVAKLEDLSAKDAQTGPAIRGDQPTIERHLTLLETQSEWRAIYQLLSDSIQHDRKRSDY
ncbi:MAG: DUF2520 domain-containing protein [Bacteroidota bacterium]